MRNILHKILIFFCLLVIIGIFLGYLSVYISSEIITFPALFGLAFPYLLCINVCFIIYWLYRRRWAFILPLFVVLIGWQILSNYFAISFSNTDIVTSEVKIMSYNVRYFNKYNWNKDPKTANNILEMVSDEDVDIVCFQEFLIGARDANYIKHIRKTNCKII